MIIDSPIISGSYAATGSLNQVGNVTITGSLTVTGPITGALTGSVDSASFATTASYVSPNTQINTASFAVTSSYASTVDYNNTVITSSFAITASYVSPATQINTASFAITASYVSPATQINTSSFAITSSYAANAELLDGLDSSAFTPINSFNSYTSSNNATVTSVAASTALALASIATLTSRTGSYTLTSSFNSYTSSNDATVNCVSSTATAALVGVAALASRTGSYATTGSNTFAGGQYFSSSFNPTGFTTTASLYTDGGLRVTRDAYISGTLYLNNLTVFGTQSVAYISSSQLNIGTNIITVNTDTPSVRFGGLAVYDSGSTGLTGSILWDSQDNQWIYSNPTGSEYDSAVFLVGPRNSGVLGNEPGISCNFLSKGNGMHHMTSSGIFENGTTTCFYGNSFISSSGVVCFAGNTTLGGALQVAGQQAAANYGGTGLNLDFTSGNIGRIASVKTTSGGSSLELHTYNTSGGDVTALNISNTGVACFASTVCAPAFVGGTISGTTGNFSGILTVAANSSANAIAINGRSSDNTGTIDFFQNNGTTRVMEIGVSPTAAEFYYDSNSPMIFYTNQCERLRITGGGNVGIGTATPTDFTPFGYGPNVEARGGEGGGFISSNSANTVRMIMQTLGSTCTGNLKVLTNHSLGFATNDVERARITAAGIACFACQVCSPAFVGGTVCGTTGTFSTTYNGGGIGMLHLTSGGTEGGSITFEKTSGTVQKYKLGNSGTSLFIYNETAVTQPLTILNNSNIGIGATSPQSQLHIYNNSAGASLRLHGTRTADGEVGVINFSNITDITGGYIIGSIAVSRSAFDNGGAMIFSTATAASTPTERFRLASNGTACFACDLTAKTLGTNDLILNNLNYECANYVDGTRGSWLIQEGACDLFIINQVSCKKYKFNLIEIE
jgi:hypothetical protein